MVGVNRTETIQEERKYNDTSSTEDDEAEADAEAEASGWPSGRRRGEERMVGVQGLPRTQ